MKQEPFVIERTYNATIDKVWKAITNKEQMKEWYFDIAEFKLEHGFEFTFDGENEGWKYKHLCKITEVIPNKKLSYSWRYDGYEGISYVSFELFVEGEGTRVKLIHEGLESFAQNGPDFQKESFAAGWTYILGTSMKNFVEKASAENK